MLLINISNEPIMKPHIVGKATIEIINTMVAPVLTLLAPLLFIITAP
jgi:hypothetical protein